MWNKNGEPVSLMFKKFFNLGENLEIDPAEPPPNSFFIEKLDGSLLGFSKYRGQEIFRTRGSFSVDHALNNSEIAQFRAQYKDFFDSIGEDKTYLFEWTSPKHKIIIDYGDVPKITLLNAVNHEDYSYAKQDELDEIARRWNLPRPARITASILDISKYKNFEGVCCYYNNDQSIIKIKTKDYCDLNRLKYSFGFNALSELYIELKYPSDEELNDYIKSKFDYETYSCFESEIKAICEAGAEMKRVVSEMEEYVAAAKERFETQKSLAIYLQSQLKGTRLALAFSIANKRHLESSKKDIFLEFVKTKKNSINSPR